MDATFQSWKRDALKLEMERTKEQLAHFRFMYDGNTVAHKKKLKRDINRLTEKLDELLAELENMQ